MPYQFTKRRHHERQKSQILIRTFLIDCIQVAIALAFASALSQHIDFLNVAVAFGLWVVAQLVAAAYFILMAKK